MKFFFDISILNISFYYFLIKISQSAFTSKNSSKSPQSVIRLGGLFPIGGGKHCKGLSPKINSVRGIQRVEAMLYAVDKINENKNILQNVFVNVTLINTCDDPQTALEEIIKSFAQREQAVYEEPNERCKIRLGGKKNILGYVGPSTSRVSKDVARLLRLFDIPQISYASTSPDLDNREIYPYFLRTVPPDQYQVRAISDLCKQLDWTSVAIIYSGGDYGQVAFEHFQKLSNNICITKSYKLEEQSHNITNILSELKASFETTRVVILFCTFQHFKELTLVSKNHDFVFIIGEIYGFENASQGKPILENLNNDTVIISMKSNENTLKDFKNYFFNLKPERSGKKLQNKWFHEYWEQRYKCNFTQNNCPEKAVREELHDDKIPYVIDAVYAFANAIDKIYGSSCPQRKGICEKMNNVDTSCLFEELVNSTYNGVFGNDTRFDEYGNINHGYDISIYRNKRLEKMGEWYNGSLELIGNFLGDFQSYCSSNCSDGEFKSYFINKPKCCFVCVKCGQNQVSTANNEGCKICDNGTKPNKKLTKCIELPVLYLDRHWVITVCVLAGVGSLLSIFCMLLFYYHKDNDFIIASAPELSYPLLLGILLSYVLAFAIIADQTVYLCAIRRFGLGFCFSLSYSSLLTKTIRLARVFNINRPMGTPPPKFIDAPSQLFILFTLVCIQFSLALIGLFLEPPNLGWVEENGHKIMVCKMPLYDIITSYLYNFILLCVCTKYTFQTRKVPACFNEARNIGFAMYTTLVIWISFLPAYIVDINKSSETIALCMNVVLHATSVLSCVFGPKVYMIVFRWERTQRKSSLHSFTQSYCVENDFVMPRKMTSQSLYSEITKLRSMSHISLSKT